MILAFFEAKTFRHLVTLHRQGLEREEIAFLIPSHTPRYKFACKRTRTPRLIQESRPRLSPQNRDEVKESTPRQRASHLKVYPFCIIKRKGVSQGSPIAVNLTEVAPTSLLEEG